MPHLDLTGQRFGRLTVVERKGIDSQRSILWLCRCDCGGEKVVPAYCLRKGRVKSCGCLERENRARLKKSGSSSFNDELLPLRESNLRLQYEVLQLRKQVRAYAGL